MPRISIRFSVPPELRAAIRRSVRKTRVIKGFVDQLAQLLDEAQKAAEADDDGPTVRVERERDK